MKVLYVINGLGTGGAERSLAELLPRLARNGVDPAVVCLNRREQGVQAAVGTHGIDVRFVTEGRLPSRVAQVRRIIRRERPDIIHTTIFEADIIGRLAAVGTGARVLTTLVNTPYDPVRLRDPNVNRCTLEMVRRLDAFTARHFTDHFHAITYAVKEASVRDLAVSPERVTVVERGRDPARLGNPDAERRRRARRELGLEDDDLVLVNVGRQEFQKGQRYLLQALETLTRRHPRLVLVMAGRAGQATPDIQQLRAEAGLEDHVRLLGHRDDLPEILQAGDVFVFPSLYEGLGGSLVEAMALGLPIVASDLPALREVLQDGVNGRLVPAASPDALSEAIEQLITSPDRARRFALRNRAVFQERFTLDRSEARMVELYQRILDEDLPGENGTPAPRRPNVKRHAVHSRGGADAAG